MTIKHLQSQLVTTKDKIKKDPSKLGQAVYDILSTEQHMQTVEETTDAMTPKYFEELMIAVNKGCKDFKSPFYVVVVRKKETLAGQVMNVLKHQYVTRQTPPKAEFLRTNFPNADHDLYEISSYLSTVTLLYTLPTEQDSRTILKHPHLYDPQLVKWIVDYNRGTLDSKEIAPDN